MSNTPPGPYVDGQVIKLRGPDGIVKQYQYNAETGTLYSIPGPVLIPPYHGSTHVAEDLIPGATTNLPGLMSADDKAKLDAMVKTRVGVLGFVGAGFPDDGGWLSGDIMLAAGTEFISLEKIGNVVRFTVDSPLPLNCNLEECAQIFWIQDETDTSSIRPPVCAGKLPGTSVYGEHKIYLMPESTVVDSANPRATLNTKGNYPSVVFKRYDDAITPGLAEYDMVLERNTDTTSKVGWSMTPGPVGVPECVWFMGHDDDGEQIRFELNGNTEPGLLGALMYKGHTLTRQMAVVTSYTTNILSTNQYSCKFWNTKDSESVGADFIATNIWRFENAESTSDDVIAPKTLVKDSTSALLEIGTLVEIWEFQIEELSGERIVRRYFNKEPNLNPETLWGAIDGIRFGDLNTARGEMPPADVGYTELTAHETDVEGDRLVEKSSWGIKGLDDPVLLQDDYEETNSVDYNGNYTSVGTTEDILLPRPNVSITIESSQSVNSFYGHAVEFPGLPGLMGNIYSVVGNDDLGVQIFGIGPNELTTATTEAGGLPQQVVIYSQSTAAVPSGNPVNNRFMAAVDYERGALVVSQLDPDEDRERPVHLWHRTSHNNVLIDALVGMPDGSRFPPIDVLMRAAIDQYDDVYMQVLSRGTLASGPFAGLPYVKVLGVTQSDIPKDGYIRTLTGAYRDTPWRYNYKAAFGAGGTQVMLIGAAGEPFLFDEDFIPGDSDEDPTGVEGSSAPSKTTVCELVKEEYNAPCLRVEFSVVDQTDAEAVQMQFKGGTLDMSEPYELDYDLPADNYVRGMKPGEYAISKVFTQDGFIETGVETPESDPSDFTVYTGGTLPAEVDGQTELWNRLRVMLRGNEMWVWWNEMLITPDPTASAELPTPVAVITPFFPISTDFKLGKVGLRLWPGAVIKQVSIREQLEQFNEFKYGQLELSDGSTGSTGGT